MKSKIEETEATYYRETTLHQHLQNIVDKSGDRLVLSSIDSGFSNIEAQLNGLQLGQLYVLGGAIAMGATTFAGKLALQVSDHSGVLFLPQVESPDKLTKTLLCIEGDIQMQKLERQPWDAELTEKVAEAMTSFKKKKFYLEKLWQFDSDELLQLIEDYVTRNDVKLVIIDNEERLFKNLKVALNSEEKYLFILKLKLLFHRLDCCGIIIKRIKSAKRTHNNPYQVPKIKDIQVDYNLADLADHIWFLHRLEYYGIEEDEATNPTKKRIDLYCMDADGAVLNNLYFRFNKRHTSFVVMVDPRWCDFLDILEEE